MIETKRLKAMRKKVLFVIESLGGGGAEKVLTTILKYIDKYRYEVTLCTIVDAGKYVEDVKQYVSYRPLISSPNPQSLFSVYLYKLKYKLIYTLPMSWVYRLFIPKGNDIEIAFCEGFVTKLLANSNNKNARKIAWVHIDLQANPWPQKLGIYRNIEEETVAYSKFDYIVAVSKTVEESFKKLYGQKEKIKAIYNPIDVADIKQKGKEKIEAYDKTVMNLVTVGRLVSQKGYDILLQVIERLKSDGYKFVLRILGEGEQFEELKIYSEQYGLEDCVKFIGFKKNPYPYIVNSDLFVCSSRSEGYSLVIAESFVLGVPVLSTYCSGPNELLDEGMYGMLVENSEDGSGLYEGLKHLLRDQTLLVKCQYQAIERGRSFSLINIMNKIETLLN